jgi:hypothetical protein
VFGIIPSTIIRVHRIAPIRDWRTIQLPVCAVNDREHQPTEAFVQCANSLFVAVTKGKREFATALYRVWRTELLHDRRQRIRSDLPNSSFWWA